MVSTYLPVVANSFTRSTTVIGLLLGIEGVWLLSNPIYLRAA